MPRQFPRTLRTLLAPTLVSAVLGAVVVGQADSAADTLSVADRERLVRVGYDVAPVVELERRPPAYVAPLAGGYRVTGTYGASSSLWSSSHTGLDLAAGEGTPIRSVARGTVTFVGWDGAYGQKTVVTLPDGTEVWYCHQSSPAAAVGDRLRPGDLLGHVGSTGNVTGAHLHLEVRPHAGGPVDPYGWLSERGAL